jgi:hypothetical protein
LVVRGLADESLGMCLESGEQDGGTLLADGRGVSVVNVGGGVQAEAGVHPVPAGLVRGGGDHAALGRVAVPADDDRPAAQLRPPQDLHGRDELVEVHVQYPDSHTSVSQVRAWPARPAPGGRVRSCP